MDDNVNDSDVEKKVNIIQVDSQSDEASADVVGSEEPTQQTQVEEKFEVEKLEKLQSETKDHTEVYEDQKSDCSLITHCSDESPPKKQNLPNTGNKPTVILLSNEECEAGKLPESEPDMFSSQLDSNQAQHESMECEDIIPSSQEESVEDICSTQILSKSCADSTSRTPPCKRKLEDGKESLGKVMCLENHPSPNEAHSSAELTASDLKNIRNLSPDKSKGADSSTEVAATVEECSAGDARVKWVEPEVKDIKIIEESEDEGNGDTNDINEDVDKRFKEITKQTGGTVESKDNVMSEGDCAKIINTRNSEGDVQPCQAVNIKVTDMTGESILANGKSQIDIQSLNRNTPRDNPFQLNFSLKMNKLISDTIVSLPGEKPSVFKADDNPLCHVLDLGNSNSDAPKYDSNIKSVTLSSNTVKCDVADTLDERCNLRNVDGITCEKRVLPMSEDLSSVAFKLNDPTLETSKSLDVITETSKSKDVTTDASNLVDKKKETSNSEDVVTETSKSDVIQTSKPNVMTETFKSGDLRGKSISTVSVTSKLEDVITHACQPEDVSDALKSKDVSNASLKYVILDPSKSDDVLSDKIESEDVTLNASKTKNVISKDISDTSKSDVIISDISKSGDKMFHIPKSGESRLNVSNSEDVISEVERLNDSSPDMLSAHAALSKSSKVISNLSLKCDVPGLNDVGTAATKSGGAESILALASSVSKHDDATVTSHPSNPANVISETSSDFVSCLSKAVDFKSDRATHYKDSNEVEPGFPKLVDVKLDLQKLAEAKSNVGNSVSLKSNVINIGNNTESDVSKSGSLKGLKSLEQSSLIQEESVKSQAQCTKQCTLDEQELSSHRLKYSSSPVKYLEQHNFVHPPTKFVNQGNEGDEYNGDGSLAHNELEVSDSQNFNLCVSLSPNTSTQSADNMSLEKSSLKPQHDDVKEVKITEVISETVIEKKADEKTFKPSASEKTDSDCVLSNGFGDTHEVMMCSPSDNKMFGSDRMDTHDDSIGIIYEEDTQSARKKDEPTPPQVKRKLQDHDPEIIEYIDIANETPPQCDDEHHNKKLRTLEKEDISSLNSSVHVLMGKHSALSDRNDSSFENESAAQRVTAVQYRRMAMAFNMKIVYDKHTKEVISRTVMQCEEIRDDRAHTSSRSSDFSSGYLADCDGKTSPGSVTSTGLYPLPKQMSRLSIVSTSSSSTTGTFNSDKNVLQSFSSSTIMPPPKEVPKERCTLKDDNLDKSGNVSPPGSIIRNYDTVIQFLDQISVVDSLNISDGASHLNYETKKFESKVCSGSEISSSSDANGHLKEDSEMKQYVDELDTPKTSRKASSTAKRRAPRANMVVVNEDTSISQSGVDSGVKLVDSGSKQLDCDSPAALSPQVGRYTRRAKNKLDFEGGKTAVARSTTPSRTSGSAGKKTVGRRRNGPEKDLPKTQVGDRPSTPEPCHKPPEPETPKSETVSTVPKTPEVIDEVHGVQIVPGVSVFARWTDKKYYSGKVENKVQRDKWLVVFDDGNSKALIDDFIIVCTQLNRGQSVYAMDRHRDFHSGVIRDSKISDGEIIYGVELDDTEEQLFVPKAKIAMSEDQANLLRESAYYTSFTSLTPKSSSSVTLDNLVEGKRPRKLSQLQLERPHSSGTISNIKPRRARSDASSVSDTGDKVSSASDCVAGVEPESYPFVDMIMACSDTGKSKGGKSMTKSSGKSKSKTSEDPDILSLLGPIPADGSTIFAGRSFLLTCSDIDYHVNTTSKKKTGSGKKGKKRSSDDFSEMSSDDPSVRIPFDKNRLTRQLLAGGGTIYENFHDVPENKYSSCILIANKALQTAKYLLCLAHSIPILHHKWVIDSVKQGSEAACCRYYLNAGWSLEDGVYKEWKDSPRTSRKPLQGLFVYIVNEAGIFFKFWHKILTALGASAAHLVDCQDLATKPDVILTDLSCFEEVVREAEARKIPLVSTTWVVQCLINWRRCGYNAHVKYRYNAPD